MHETRNLDEIMAIAGRQEIAMWIGGAEVMPPEETLNAIVQNDHNRFYADATGFVAFHGTDDNGLEMHLAFLKGHRGQEAVWATRGCITDALAVTGADYVVGRPTPHRFDCRLLLKNLGFSEQDGGFVLRRTDLCLG